MSLWHRVLPIGFLVLAQLPAVALAANELTGVWQIMSLGADRRVEIWQDGDAITAYRVMYPEFDGEKYKLEHVLRGTVNGNALQGRLLVREEDVSELDDLRPFFGRIDGANKILLDGLPLEKTGEALTTEPPGVPKKGKRRSRSAQEVL